MSIKFSCENNTSLFLSSLYINIKTQWRHLCNVGKLKWLYQVCIIKKKTCTFGTRKYKVAFVLVHVNVTDFDEIFDLDFEKNDKRWDHYHTTTTTIFWGHFSWWKSTWNRQTNHSNKMFSKIWNRDLKSFHSNPSNQETSNFVDQLCLPINSLFFNPFLGPSLSRQRRRMTHR